jgi:hypothetical protein
VRPGKHSRGTFGGEKALIFAAIGEAITGLALLIAPQLRSGFRVWDVARVVALLPWQHINLIP